MLPGKHFFSELPDKIAPLSLTKGIPILPSDLSLVKDYNRYVKLFREIFEVH